MDQQLMGGDALVRWENTLFGQLFSDLCIPTAEDIGVVQEEAVTKQL